MSSEGFAFHSSTCTNDFLDCSPEEDPTDASSTLRELPILCNVDGISSGYGLVTTPGTYPHPSACQPDLFDQAITGSLPIYYGENAETMQDERSAFQNFYVTAAQSVSQSLGNVLDELLPVSSHLSYPQVPLSLHPSARSNDPTSSDLPDWFASIDGGSDDTWFSSVVFGGLYDSSGAQNPPVPGSHSMDTTNCAQIGFYSPIDFPTLAPGTSNIPDVENQNALQAVATSVLQLEHTDVVASGIQASHYELSLRPTYILRSYPSPSSSPHPSFSDPYPSDVQDRSSSNGGGSDDPSLSSSPPGDLDDSMGVENSSVGGNSRTATNCAQSDLCSRTDHIPDDDNAKALHALIRSIPRPSDASPLAFGITSSQYLPSFNDELLKPCPEGYKKARVNSIQKWRGGPHSLLSGLSVYYLRDSPATLHPCPVDGCTAQFSGNSIRTHLRTNHPGITTQPYLQCKECNPEASIVAKNYANHVLDRHSGHSILCAYCLTSQSRVKNLPRHLLKHCSGLTHAKKRKATA